MAKVFDGKSFNGEVFGKYVETVSDLKRNELIKAKVFRVRNDLKAKFPEQVGGNYATIPMKAPIGTDYVNYDGNTNIDIHSRKTFTQGCVVVGRANGFGEKDFSSDITGGENFLPLANEIAHYKDNIDQETLLSILKGIFSMTSTEGAKFVTQHTNDITGTGDGKVDVTTLNSTIQKACGDNKGVFQVVICHSIVATNLENLNLINHLKYTDSMGVQRDLGLGTWNGRLVLIDDTMPVNTVTPSGGTAYQAYTTYILGADAFDFVDCGATVPYSMDRDEKLNGGETWLFVRQRKMWAPKGISFTNSNLVSPTNANLETASNWDIANDGATSNKSYYPIKGIPIARIISRG